MEKISPDFVDRMSMHLFYDKLYTKREKRPPLKALILFTEMNVEDLPNVASQRTKISKIYDVNVRTLQENLYKVFLQRTIGLEVIKREVIIDAGYDGAWIVFTDAESYFVNHVLERFFNNLYPMISRLYLNYSQIRLLLQAIRESYRGKTSTTFFTVRREKRSPTEKRMFPSKKGTEILWEEDADEELRKLSAEYRVKVDILNFDVRDENEALVLQAHITRRGLCKLKFGSFSAFYENVVCKAIKLGLDWRDFYDKRERRVEKGMVTLRPLRIDYEFNFDTEQLRWFAGKISSSYSSSIIHEGNPYFVANVCDYEDGSSFGVAILGNAITITPLTRASPQAVWKLLNKIQELLGDGEIVDIKI